MPKKQNRYRSIFFLVGIGVLSILVYNLGVDTIVRNIRLTGWWFLPIIGVWLVVYLLNALSWRIIIHDGQTPHVPFLNIYQMTVSGYAINYLTPVVAMGGEPYRILELRQFVGGKKASSSVILYSMMHIMSHFLFWTSAVALIMACKHPPLPVMGVLSTVAGLCVVAIVFFLKGYRQGLLMKSLRIAEKIPYLGKRVRQIDGDRLEKIRETDVQIAELFTFRRKDFFKSLFLEYLSRFVSCLEVYFIVKALHTYDFTFVDAIIAVAVTSLFANLLFFAPLQLGAREGGFLLAFQGMAIPTGLGIYTSLITRIRETFWILIGLLLMYRPRFTKQQNK
ncbi:MAG: flippase-like domain-containing protein [Bacteroidales bacterium]|jgi:uncharacterized protein (TIRG00374 family)|nr:flippase-like domain-containing protein [Bacteroidales bacterium]